MHETQANIKEIIHRVVLTKKGTSYDRTFPDCMVGHVLAGVRH